MVAVRRARCHPRMDRPSALDGALAALQAYLEGHRRDPDNEELEQDLRKARAEVEIAWLELQLAS